MENLCKNCGKPLSEVKVYRKQVYCSHECYSQDKKGKDSKLKKELAPRFCKECGKELSHRQNLYGRPYCSRGCAGKAKQGKPGWNKGLKMNLSPEVRKKLSDGLKERNLKRTQEQKQASHAKMVSTRKNRGFWNKPGTVINRTKWNNLTKYGEEHNGWKGDEASYSSKHKWACRTFEKTGICEDCGVTPKPRKGSMFGTHWHSFEYKRERGNWVELCQKCHIKRHKN